MTDALFETGVARCRREGLTVTRSDDRGEPPGVARPANAVPSPDDARPFEPRRATPADGAPSVSALLSSGRTVAIESIRDPEPTLVLSRLWNDRNNGRAALFVAPDRETADRIEAILAPPVGVRAADTEGRRFFAGPDRVALAEGGYAAVPAGTTLEWQESTTAREPVGLIVDGEGGDADVDAETAVSGSWLELRADGEVVARLDGVDTLDCPQRAQFPYAYRRDDDKRIRVVDFAGRPVQRYTGIGAMRDGGFQPVPAPLVPEHMFDGAVDGWWAVLVAE
ncbi:hypothetical protein [Haloplanus rubicundus]|uniref:Uncharacterized protein n=1 Tax=Haloplanus rubicundus TaxID=1547898 RepID=A0A345EFY9_9EURY|nr:hypothetical protein [Haloplanus rubicundus]AXG11111.1 hypothetical protein DU484_15320 [Haloplanus rubicundus]